MRRYWYATGRASSGPRLGLGLGLGLEEEFVFDSKRENRDRALEAVESVRGESRVGVRVTGSGGGWRG